MIEPFAEPSPTLAATPDASTSDVGPGPDASTSDVGPGPDASLQGAARVPGGPLASSSDPAPPSLGAGPAHPRPSYLFLALVSVLSLAADLATKTWAEKTLQLNNEIPAPKTIIKNFFTFVLAKNKGGAWGLLQNAPENVRKPFFVVVSVLAILFIVSLYRRLHPRQVALKWGLPLVLGGALGNLIDRIRYGWVIDFIDLQATYKGGPHHWPTFNVADIAICIGVGLMALDMLTARRPDPPAAPASRPSAAPDAVAERASSADPHDGSV